MYGCYSNRCMWRKTPSGPAGFAVLGADSHVGALYVRDAASKAMWVGALLDAVLAAVRGADLQRLYAEASAFSQPLFEKKGFGALPVRQAAWRGKTIPTFSDALEALRLHLWQHTVFSTSA